MSGGGFNHETGQGWPNAHRNRAKTHCPQGHPYAGDNLLIANGGRRICRTCKREHGRATYRRRKEAQAAALRPHTHALHAARQEDGP